MAKKHPIFIKISHFQLILNKILNKFRLQPWGRAHGHQNCQKMGFLIVECIGAAGWGEHRKRSPPPEIEKIVVKNDVISEGSIFRNNFPKIS